MCFQKWFLLQETNLQDLYQSTVQAFPKTTKRQHAIDPIEIKEISTVPYLGMKSLFVKGIAHNTSNGKEYAPIVLFKGVSYHNSRDSQDWVEIVASDGSNYIFERINKDNDVLVRCNCPDFSWRFNYFDHKDQSLYGRVRRKYEANVNPGSANPKELPGMCKHLIKLIKSLNNTGFLEE